eukprot:TRINITY_DN8507_c0_g2_i2.p1 TRINITY_DN8507_c0_g2~~TRINITY_DN8507_c0_g2_i2.p1  ORF type:complete len:756 (-),score=212.34 TRINITY_DN8507_c0_g2_i2:254-2521(-)
MGMQDLLVNAGGLTAAAPLPQPALSGRRDSSRSLGLRESSAAAQAAAEAAKVAASLRPPDYAAAPAGYGGVDASTSPAFAQAPSLTLGGPGLSRRPSQQSLSQLSASQLPCGPQTAPMPSSSYRNVRLDGAGMHGGPPSEPMASNLAHMGLPSGLDELVMQPPSLPRWNSQGEGQASLSSPLAALYEGRNVLPPSGGFAAGAAAMTSGQQRPPQVPPLELSGGGLLRQPSEHSFSPQASARRIQQQQSQQLPMGLMRGFDDYRLDPASHLLDQSSAARLDPYARAMDVPPRSPQQRGGYMEQHPARPSEPVVSRSASAPWLLGASDARQQPPQRHEDSFAALQQQMGLAAAQQQQLLQQQALIAGQSLPSSMLSAPGPPLPPGWGAAPGYGQTSVLQGCRSEGVVPWPPPPLPPVSTALRHRLEALEKQRDSHQQMDELIERRLEQMSKSHASRSADLEAQMERNRLEWERKATLLEASKTQAELQVAKIMEEAKTRQQSLLNEREALQAELSRERSARERDRRQAEDNERLSMEEKRLRVDVERKLLDAQADRDSHVGANQRVLQLEADLEEARVTVKRLTDSLQKEQTSVQLEVGRTNELMKAFEDKCKAHDEEVTKLQNQLHKALAHGRTAEEEAERLRRDIGTVKKAHEERIRSEKSLRDTISSELGSKSMAQRELERVRAERDALRARLKLQADGQELRRQSITSDGIVYASGEGSRRSSRASEMLVQVDITNERDAIVLSGDFPSGFRE